MPASLILRLAGLLLALSMLFGGGARHGRVSDAIPQIFAVIALYFVAQPGFARLRSNAFHLFCLISLIALPLLQLLPLPSSLWLALPGRDAVRAIYSGLEIEPSFHSLSLRPSETWRAFLSLMPPVALGLAVVALDLRSRIMLILIVLAFAGLNVLVGLVQIIGGKDSALYFYDMTNRGRAVGLFANANHYTSLLCATIPFAAALLSGSSERRVPIRDAALGISLFLLLVGLAISGSRTAIILGGASLLTSLFFIAGKTVAQALSGNISRTLAIAAGLFILPILFGIGFIQIFLRFQSQDPIDDLRFQILETLLSVIKTYMPFGSGFGTFDRVYGLQEKLETLTPFFVNRAHNDVLELLIEGGAFSAIALIGFGVGLSVFTFRALTQSGLIEERLEKACVISLWVLTIHSFWDYPLRTIAVSSVFAIALGCLVKPIAINVETISDVMRHLKHMRLYEWIEKMSGQRPHRRRRRSFGKV